jgi:hypothetical protein
MVNARSIPLGAVTKFAISGRKLRLYLSRSNKSPSHFEHYTTKLPDIPRASEALLKVLEEFQPPNLLVSLDNSTARGVKRVTKKKPHVNGFLAYRIYYCSRLQSLVNMDQQRKFSTLISKVWKDEQHKDSWKRFASEYNRSVTNLPFPEWLQSMQESTPEVDIRPIAHTNTWSHRTNNVEDIFR